MAGPIESLGVGYYMRLLTWQYKTLPVFTVQWLQDVLTIINDVTDCLQSMDTVFDLDYAEGAQLDILGQIIGVSRTVTFQPTGSVSPILDDATYRILLRATLFNNLWDGTVGSLYPFWQTMFPGGRIAIDDHQNMSATILLGGSFSSILQDLITNGYIVPRPQGVLYNYTFADPPFFGFDREDSLIAGLGVGKWI